MLFEPSNNKMSTWQYVSVALVIIIVITLIIYDLHYFGNGKMPENARMLIRGWRG